MMAENIFKGMVEHDLKICYIALKSYHTNRWLEYFARRGYEVHLITPEYDNIDIPDVEIHLISPKASKLSPLLKAIIIRNLVKKIKPDVIHAIGVVPFGLYGALSGFHPFVVSPLGSDVAVFPEKSGIHKFLVEYVLKKADVVPAEDEIMKSRLMELKCSKDQIALLRVVSVDIDRFHPSKRSESLIKELRMENEFLVLNTRPLTPNYYVDVFIQAMPFAIDKISTIKFIILLGSGYERCRLEKLAQKLGVNDRILWMEGVPHSKMPEYLASVDLYVDTFVNVENNKVIDKGNGIGVTTVEAMACATPQILPDRVEVKTGELYQSLTYRPLDYRDLAEKIIGLLRNEKLRKQIGNRSRNAAINIADENVVMKNWEKLYNSLSSFS